MVITDGALSVALRAFSEGTFGPARMRVPKMLAEERFHVSFGIAWYQRFAAASDEARSLFRTATNCQLPATLAWLGGEDEASCALVELGVMPPAVYLTTACKASVHDVLADVDAVEPASDWDCARGRAPGQPDTDPVDRARDTKNRALFVE
jgi:hypothetical protein